ncbi:MAG TPA: hypothetical protein VGJ05_09510 [Fimbriiglobus sp.]|jgi:hypothetical protein
MTKQQDARKGPSYPYYSWAQSLKIADAVKSLGGDRAPVSKGDIAHHLEMSDDSQSLAQSIAAARTYGMIEGHGEYTLTDEGKRYFYPESPIEKRLAELKFVTTPPAHEMLIRRFDGNQLPASRNLGTLLAKFGVPKSWVDRTASQFKDACDRLGLFDNGGHLRYGVAMRSAGKPDAAVPSSEELKDQRNGNEVEELARHIIRPGIATAKSTATEPSIKTTGPENTVWSVNTPEGTLRVETPNPLPKALWVRLKRYVLSQNPSEEEKDDEKN